MLVAGFCIKGPYRYNLINLLNPGVRFDSFGYQKKYIHPETLKRFKSGAIQNGNRVYVAMWDMGKSEKGVLLREGEIDFIRMYSDFVRLNIFLDPMKRRMKHELVVFPLGKPDEFLLREI